MPEFNAKCETCRVTFRAWVYGFRTKRVAYCPLCQGPARPYIKRPEGFVELIYRGMQGVRAVWERQEII